MQGETPPDSAEYARVMVRAVAGHAHQPVLSARVRLTQRRDPAAGHSAVARASLDVNGQIARAPAAAEAVHEAIDLLKERLDYQHSRLEHR
ncbi:hypothetical protein ACFVHB_09965 [Kitasatospora sp. NPDC127111]|uniref:hypothetical protein n=1 Tax=Kitasatospora sp. NPDC127111 TaxID=3345363 RepID=UPI003628974F